MRNARSGAGNGKGGGGKLSALGHALVLVRFEDLADVGVVECALDLDLALELLDRASHRVEANHLHRVQLTGGAMLHGNDTSTCATTEYCTALCLVGRPQLVLYVLTRVIVHESVRECWPVRLQVREVA